MQWRVHLQISIRSISWEAWQESQKATVTHKLITKSINRGLGGTDGARVLNSAYRENDSPEDLSCSTVVAPSWQVKSSLLERERSK